MNSKLTLKLNQQVIEKAKRFASSNRISLSKLIENYLLSLTKEEEYANTPTPLVKSLSGIIKEVTEERKGYTDFLIDKYK